MNRYPFFVEIYVSSFWLLLFYTNLVRVLRIFENYLFNSLIASECNHLLLFECKICQQLNTQVKKWITLVFQILKCKFELNNTLFSNHQIYGHSISKRDCRLQNFIIIAFYVTYQRGNNYVSLSFKSACLSLLWISNRMRLEGWSSIVNSIHRVLFVF